MKKKNTGFTLLEAIITVSIAAILASIALPNLQSFVASSRMENGMGRFHMALAYARSEAIKRGFDVSICVSNANQTACDTSRNDYAKGWLIFTDYDGNGVYDNSVTADTTGDGIADSAETILQVSPALDKKISITNAGVFEDAITYKPTGQTTAALAAPNDRFYINSNGKTHKNLVISVTGRIKACSLATPTAGGMC